MKSIAIEDIATVVSGELIKYCKANDISFDKFIKKSYKNRKSVVEKVLNKLGV